MLRIPHLANDCGMTSIKTIINPVVRHDSMEYFTAKEEFVISNSAYLNEA